MNLNKIKNCKHKIDSETDKCKYCGIPKCFLDGHHLYNDDTDKCYYCNIIRCKLDGKHLFNKDTGKCYYCRTLSCELKEHYFIIGKCEYCNIPECKINGKHYIKDRDKCYCRIPRCFINGHHLYNDDTDKCYYYGNIRCFIDGRHIFSDDTSKCYYCGKKKCEAIGKHYFYSDGSKCYYCNIKKIEANQKKINLRWGTNYLIKAMPGENGLCAKYVQNALEESGFEFTRVGCADAMANLLKNLQFDVINFNTGINSPKNGDIVVELKTSNHPFGHVQMWCEDINSWVSYFIQKNKQCIVHSDKEGQKIYFRY